MIIAAVTFSAMLLPIWITAALVFILAVSIVLGSSEAVWLVASPAALFSVVAVALSLPVVAWSCSLALARTFLPGTSYCDRMVAIAPIAAVGALLQSNSWLDLLVQNFSQQSGTMVRLLSWGSFGSVIISCVAIVVIALTLIPLMIELPIRWFASHSGVKLVLPWHSIRLLGLIALIFITLYLVSAKVLNIVAPVQIVGDLIK